MKKINQLFIVVFAAVLLFAFTGRNVQFAETGFNGKWVLDSVKSDLGGIPLERAAPLSMTLTQTNESIIFERLFKGMLEPSRQTLTLDGKATETDNNKNKSVRTLKMSDDKGKITVDSKVYMMPAGEEPWQYTRTETYLLSDDRKGLTLTRVAITPEGTETVNAQYNRVK